MVTIAGASSTAGLAFALRGAWPVAVFCGLAVGLVYLAFRLNYHAARLSERIVLSTAEHPGRWTRKRIRAALGYQLQLMGLD